MAQKKKNIFIRIFLWLTLILLLFAGAAAYVAYTFIYLPNVNLGEKKSEIVYVPTGSSFEDVVHILSDKHILKNKRSFVLLSEYKKYKDPIKPGRYRIMANMSNNELVNLLRAGLQEPVTVTFTNIRTKEQLASRVSKKLEADSTELLSLLNDEPFLNEKLGLNRKTVLTLFIPNTYQFNWNTSATEFLERMQLEYKKFWTEERKKKAKDLHLSQSQISTLASIVQAEQMQFPEERPIIAGLYLNRLRIGMPLQSDPTIIYAIGDYSINRVLDKDKEVDSPYNTYLHNGLPPGPIYVPEISSIDAVLNYKRTNYLYMCAKEDFSGKHNFAGSLNEHNRNAQRYRNALNKSKIMR